MPQLATPVTVTQAIAIDCSASKAFAFVRDAQRWLPWAMPEAESVQPLPFGQWLVKTPAGFLKLRPRYDATRSVLDYELVHPVAPASCYGPVHVAATPTGCHLAITFVKPECLPLPDFEVDMLRTAASLHLLKLMLEQH